MHAPKDTSPKVVDMKLFPGLTPRAFVIPSQDQQFVDSKHRFLVGPSVSSASPGLYGQDAKLEYNYLQPAYMAQFDQLISAYQQLGQELKPPVTLDTIGNIRGFFSDEKLGLLNINESQRQGACERLKQQLEDVLFCMRTAFVAVSTAQNSTLSSSTYMKITATLTKFNEAFGKCSEGITAALLDEQVQWSPSEKIADYLLRWRIKIVDMVVDGDAHRMTAARAIAYQQGYGVIPPAHTDPFPHHFNEWVEKEIRERLDAHFVSLYTYEAICNEVSTAVRLNCVKVLEPYKDKSQLTYTEKEKVLAALKILLDSGICQENDIIETLPLSAEVVNFRINPGLLTHLSLYCALYAPLILAEDGFVKPDSSFVAHHIKRVTASGGAKTLLMQLIKDTDFFTLLALLKTRPLPSEIKACNPHLLTSTDQTVLSLLLSPQEQKQKEKKSDQTRRDFLPWERLPLVAELLKHPASTQQALTSVRFSDHRTYAMFTAMPSCPASIFHLFWDTLMSMDAKQQPGPGPLNPIKMTPLPFNRLAPFANQKDQQGWTALMYAVKGGELERVEKLTRIPELQLSGFDSVGDDTTPAIAEIKDFLRLLDAIEKNKITEGLAYFTKRVVVEAKSPDVVAMTSVKKDRARYKKLLTLLHDRYGNKQHPHHRCYQQLLLAIAEKEDDVVCLVALKQYVSSIDLHQPRPLRLKTGVVEQETPLRAAIRDHDENDRENNHEDLTEYLLKKEKVNPYLKVGAGKENAWMLIARNGLFDQEQQEVLLGHIILHSQWKRELYSILTDLLSADYSSHAFSYILTEMRGDLSKKHWEEQGRDRVATATDMRGTFIESVMDQKFRNMDHLNRDAEVNWVRIGQQQEDLKLREERELDIAKALGKVVMRPVDSAAWAGTDRRAVDVLKKELAQLDTVLYRVVASKQRKKVESLLLETSELDFKAVFSIPEIQQAPVDEAKDSDKTDPQFVIHLMRLLKALHQSPPDYAGAITRFSRLMSFITTSEHYEKQYTNLLTIIYRQCRMGAELSFCYEAFFKRLANVETHVVGLNCIKKYSKINLVRQLCLAATSAWTAKQFMGIWRELQSSLVEFKPLKTLVDNLVADVKDDEITQQLDKFKIIASQFVVLPYLASRSTATATPTTLDHLINLLLELKAGHWERAFMHYAMYGEKLSGITTELSPIPVEIAAIIKKQCGDFVLQKFSRIPSFSAIPRAGLLSIHQLIKEAKENKDEKDSQDSEASGENINRITPLFLQQVALATSGTDDVIENFYLLLFLFAHDKDQSAGIFNKNLMIFCQGLVSHFSADGPLKISLILQVAVFNRSAAAHLFCRIFLYKNVYLLPEKRLLQQLHVLQQSWQSKVPQSVWGDFGQEMLTYLYGELLHDPHFLTYTSVLTFFAKQLDVTQPISWYVSGAQPTKEPALAFALRQGYYSLAKQILDSTPADAEPAPFVQLMAIADRPHRQQLIAHWLSGEPEPQDIVKPEPVVPGPDLKEVKERKILAVPVDETPPAKVVRLKMDENYTDTQGDNWLMIAVRQKDETLAITLLKYMAKVLGASPERLKKFVWHFSRRYPVLRYALSHNQEKLMLEILLLKPIIRDEICVLAGLGTGRLGFVAVNIFNFIYHYREKENYFPKCIDPAIIGSSAEQQQVIQLLHIYLNQDKTPFLYDVSTCLVDFYGQYDLPIILAVMRSFPQTVQLIIEYLLKTRNLFLLKMILQQGLPLEEKTKKKILKEVCKDELLIDFLDCCLVNKIHRDASDMKVEQIYDLAITENCAPLVFIKIFAEDAQNILFTKTIYSRHNILLVRLIRKLVEKAEVTSQCLEDFKILLLCSDYDSALLPALLQLFHKKLGPTLLQALLSHFLQRLTQWSGSQMRSAVQECIAKYLESLGGAATQTTLPVSADEIKVELPKNLSFMPLCHQAIWTRDFVLLQREIKDRANVKVRFHEKTPLSLVLYNCQVVDGVYLPLMTSDMQLMFVQALLQAGAGINQCDTYSTKKIYENVHAIFCSFAVFLTVYQHGQGDLAFSEYGWGNDTLSRKKQCFCRMLDSSLKLPERVDFFATLLLAASDAELDLVFTMMPTKKQSAFHQVIDAFFADRKQYARCYLQDKSCLHNLLKRHYFSRAVEILIEPLAVPQQDTVLHLLLRHGSFDWALQLMRTAKLDLQQGNEDKETPLMLTMQARCAEPAQRHAVIAHLLSEVKAIDATTVTVDEQFTALMIAAQNPYCDIESFQQLLAICKSAVINQRSRAGQIALEIAVTRGQTTKVQALLTRNECDRNNMLAAVSLAHETHQPAMVDLFFAQDAMSDGAHPLKQLLITKYKEEQAKQKPNSALLLSLRALVARSYGELYAGVALPYEDMPVEDPLLYSALVQHYTSYESLFGDGKGSETIMANRIELLQRAQQLNTALFNGLSPLDYSLQKHNEPLVSQLLLIESLVVTATQLTAIHAQLMSAFKEKWLPILLAKFVRDSYRADNNFTKAITLFADWYVDLPAGDSAALLALLEKIKPLLDLTVFERLHADVLHVLVEHLEPASTVVAQPLGGTVQTVDELKVHDLGNDDLNQRITKIAAYIDRDGWHLAIPELFVLFNQHGLEGLASGITNLPFASPAARVEFIEQFCVEVLKAERITLLADLVKHPQIVTIVPKEQLLTALNASLQNDTRSFSQPTLVEINKIPGLKSLWPNAALASMRACHVNRPTFTRAISFVEYVFTTTLQAFIAAPAASWVTLLEHVLEVQEKLLTSCARSDDFIDLCQQIRKIRTGLLLLAVQKRVVDWVKILCKKTSFSQDLSAEYDLVDMNVSVTIGMQGTKPILQPLVFKILAKAQEEVKGTAGTLEDMLTAIIKASTWQDDRKNEAGATLVMQAVFARADMFKNILQVTRTPTLLLQDYEGRNVVDYTLEGAIPPFTQASAPKILREALQQRFADCLQVITELKDRHNNLPNEPLKLPTEEIMTSLNRMGVIDINDLCAQARALAGEILKFDRATLGLLQGSGLWRGPFSETLFLWDTRQWQAALAGKPEVITDELLKRLTKPSPWFVSTLASAWSMIKPSSMVLQQKTVLAPTEESSSPYSYSGHQV